MAAGELVDSGYNESVARGNAHRGNMKYLLYAAWLMSAVWLLVMLLFDEPHSPSAAASEVLIWAAVVATPALIWVAWTALSARRAANAGGR